MLSLETVSLANLLRDELNSHHYWRQRKDEAEKARVLATTELAKSEQRFRGLVEQLAQALKEVE